MVHNCKWWQLNKKIKTKLSKKTHNLDTHHKINKTRLTRSVTTKNIFLTK